MRLLLLALPAFALLTGCEKAVTVVSPDSYPNQPVTEITVKFSQHFKPGTFRAKLDGNEITALFAPAPAPGGHLQRNFQAWNAASKAVRRHRHLRRRPCDRLA